MDEHPTLATSIVATCGMILRRALKINKLLVTTTLLFRFLMKYNRNCSASGMFVFNGVPSFMEAWRKYMYGFKQRLTNSDNAIIAATASACRLSSNLWKRWDCILYPASDSYQ